MREHLKRASLWLIIILLAGAFVRFYGLTAGFPFEFHVDESFIIRPTLEMYRGGTFRPPHFLYPSLLYYVLLACAYVVGLFKEPTLFDLYVVGRSLSALAGVATIFVVYLLGRRAYNETTALLAAALYAFTVTALRESHFYTTDSLNTFFITLAIYYTLRVGLGDGRGNYLTAGVAAGLAAGTKYNGALILVPLFVAHLMRASTDAGSQGSYAARLQLLLPQIFSRWMAGAALVSFLVFLLTTPYALVNPAQFLRTLTEIGPALSRDVVEGNHHYIGTTAYWFYVENCLFWAMGPVLEAACLVGFCYALARRRKPDLIIALWLALYFGLVGGWLNKATRYTLPMLPCLTLLGARMFVESARALKSRGRRAAASLVVAAACVTLASAVLYSLAYLNVYTQPHPSVAAVRWAFANIPAGSTILLEEPTPQERPQPDGAKLIYDDPSFDFGAHAFRFKPLWVPHISWKTADLAPMRAELQEALAGVDYIMMSTRWYEGLHDSPEASPVVREYYASLLSGAAGFELIKEFNVRPRLFGLEINDSSAELNFRIFDHPTVWVFKRKMNASAPAVGSGERD